MSIEIRPYGYKCKEPRCTMCYQRDNKKIKRKPNFKKIKRLAKEAYEERSDDILLFGGDIGVYPDEKKKEMIKWSCSEFGKATIQTGGWWIDEKWIEWMSQYNVHLGLSIEGPYPLNEERAGDPKEYTSRLIDLIPRIKRELSLGIITTLHQANASEDRYPKFKEWIKWLDSIGVSGRIHLLQPQGNVGLNSERLTGVLLDLAELAENLKGNWRPFTDIPKVLEGDGNVTCVWNGCDPFHTPADYSIDPDGVSVCSRNFQQGLTPRRGNQRMHVRTNLLKQVPQEEGGCKECEWFEECIGFCPGSAIDHDWRNRTVHCHQIKALLSWYSQKIDISEEKETTQNENEVPRPKGRANEEEEHGDKPHGDWEDHGDSYQ